jgi:hypothetical protein
VRAEHRDFYLGEKTIAVELGHVKHEMDNTRCDKAFLRSLCNYTGAQYVDVNQINAKTFDRFRPYRIARQDAQLQPVWPKWQVLAFLCAMLVLQWFLRRAKGLI